MTRTRTLLMLTACSIAAMALLRPDRARADDECGPVNTATDPQAATCTGAFNPYPAGITYDQTGTPADIRISLAGTAAVATAANGISVTGDNDFDADVRILNAASIAAGPTGAQSIASGLGNATISNGGTIAATAVGLSSAAGAGGTASVSNTANGNVTVTGAGALVGIVALGGSAAIANAGTVTVNGATSGFDVSGLLTETTGGAATVANSGAVVVTGGSGAAAGIGGAYANTGATTATNTGVLTVTGGAGGAYGFRLVGGTDIAISDAQTAAGTTTTTVTGAGNLTGASVTGASGNVGIGLTGVPIAINAASGAGTGIAIAGGAGASVNVAATSFGSTAYGANLSVSGATGATGVTLTGVAGANAVTFSGARLDVASGATASGILVTGGTNVTVAMLPAGGSATLTVSGAGAARGAMLGGSGALGATFGDSVSVTSSAAGATGITMAGGTSQTLTLSKGLTVSAAAGTATGVLLQGTGSAMTVHAAGPIQVTGTGGAVAAGISATGSGGLTVDGAPAITVSGGNIVTGIAAVASSGPISLATGAITVSSTSISAASTGVGLANTNGAITVAAPGIIDVTGGGPNAGVAAQTGGATGAISLTLGTVRLHGSTATGSGLAVSAINGTAGTSATNVTLGLVQTSGRNAQGVLLSAAPAGAATLTLGTSVAGVHAGGVTTTGASSGAVVATAGNGLLTVINNGLVSTGGAASPGIVAGIAPGGTGGVTLNSWQVATGGANSNAIDVSTNSGAASVTSATATATGAGSNAIRVATATGAATINLADGGATSSTAANGILVATGGTATINLGAAAGSTASVGGGLWGINSTATGGTTLTVRGSLTGAGGAALRLAGGSNAIVNAGTINGFVTITATGNSFTNSGTWNLFGADSSINSSGANVLGNSGTINVAPNATTATALALLAPGTALTLNNSGTISLQQGAGGAAHTGDVLNIGAAQYTGSGNARLLVDANLGNAAVGVSAVQTADRLVAAAGSVAGATMLVVNDLAAATPGQFNLAGIPIVQAGAGVAGGLVLQGGTIHKSYVDYQLTRSGGVYSLVGLPSQIAFEIVRTGAQAQSFWRRTGDAWAGQMRAPGFAGATGVGLWAQGIYADGTDRARPSYTVTAINGFTLTPDLDIKNRWAGALFGLDYGMGSWGVGVVGGFGDQRGRFEVDGDSLNLDGYTAGVYARWQNGGGFLQALVKYDGYKVRQISVAPSFEARFDGSTIGAQVQAGYDWKLGATFIEPVVALSWTAASLDTFSSPGAGATVDFGRASSVHGNAGVRIGTSRTTGSWTVAPYVGAYAQGDLDRDNRTTIAAGPTALAFADDGHKANALGEIGIVGRSDSGFEIMAVLNGATGGNLREVSGRLGLGFRW